MFECLLGQSEVPYRRRGKEVRTVRAVAYRQDLTHESKLNVIRPNGVTRHVADPCDGRRGFRTLPPVYLQDIGEMSRFGDHLRGFRRTRSSSESERAETGFDST